MDTLTVRPATAADAPAICALMNAVDVIEIGREETDLAELETELRHPEMDLAHDSWLAFEGDRLVVYACLWCDGEPERIDADHYVLPEHQDAGAHVLGLLERRAFDRAREGGADKAVVHLNLNTDPTVDTDRLAARGWRRVRRFNVMTRALTPEADPAPAPLPGLTLRDCREEADRRLAHALVEEAMAEHFDHTPRSYQQWLDDLGLEAGFDWSLVWIATLAGQGDVAVAVTRDNRATMGWIRTLGVTKEARGRGIGGYLLRHCFAVYAGRGRDTMGLGVDTLNASGALALYEAHGMSPHYAVDTWEITVHSQE
ncbi:GNAT family N-acetyltransferase [Streptomyces sp. NPDC090022]|uniref:GNAT family N-acetyltransferase n=1 Tax=Streptomyces sp. NPDC090022 TaxID=3365920 RepID=UPI00382C9969